MKSAEIIEYCNQYLNIQSYQDYCPNGLQVEGDNRKVKKIILGVSASLELFEKAQEEQADLILVHHGLFWKKDSPVIQGPLRKRVAYLLHHGIALAGYHLPLDFHPQVGNNVQLAQQFNAKLLENQNAEFEGVLAEIQPCSIEKLGQFVESTLQRTPLVLPFGKTTVRTLGILTGAAQNYFVSAIQAKVDCFITGEVSENNFAMSQEYGVHFIAAGHYHTERYGIQALGKHLEKQFSIETQFLEIFNPI